MGRCIPVVSAALLWAAGAAGAEAAGSEVVTGPEVDDFQTLYAAMGCYWYAYDLFSKIQGVVEVRLGYTGGEEVYPRQLDVIAGTTGHVEVVEVTFGYGLTTMDLVKAWAEYPNHNVGKDGAQFGEERASITSRLWLPNRGHLKEAMQLVAKMGVRQVGKVILCCSPKFQPALAPSWHCVGLPPTEDIKRIADMGGERLEGQFRNILAAGGGQQFSHLFITFARYDERMAVANWVAHLDRVGIQTWHIMCLDDKLVNWLGSLRTKCTKFDKDSPERRWRFLHLLVSYDTNVVLSDPSTVFVRNPLGIVNRYTSTTSPKGKVHASLLVSRGGGPPLHLDEQWQEGGGVPRTDFSFWRSRSGLRRFSGVVATWGTRMIQAHASQDAEHWKKVKPTMSSLLAATLEFFYVYQGHVFTEDCTNLRKCHQIRFHKIFQKPGIPQPPALAGTRQVARTAALLGLENGTAEAAPPTARRRRAEPQGLQGRYGGGYGRYGDAYSYNGYQASLAKTPPPRETPRPTPPPTPRPTPPPTPRPTPPPTPRPTPPPTPRPTPPPTPRPTPPPTPRPTPRPTPPPTPRPTPRPTPAPAPMPTPAPMPAPTPWPTTPEVPGRPGLRVLQLGILPLDLSAIDCGQSIDDPSEGWKPSADLLVCRFSGGSKALLKSPPELGLYIIGERHPSCNDPSCQTLDAIVESHQIKPRHRSFADVVREYARTPPWAKSP